MSISSIISTANSALSVAQSRLALTSTNITNANTIGYTRKTADVTTSIVGGQGTGVQIIGIGNDVNDKLHKDVVSALSKSGHDSILSAYYETVLSAFGTTKGGSDLSDALTALGNALSEAIADPDSVSALADIQDALGDWTKSVNATSETIQSARKAADTEISESVESVNALLRNINSLNKSIAKATADGNATGDLEDQRRTALESLSSYIDVKTFTNSSGEMQIYTSSGQPLLTSTVHPLSYSASGNLSADNVYESDGSGTISGIMIDGKDCTADFSGGSIGALLTMRDETLPGLQDTLEELSQTVQDNINAITNSFTAVPPPTSLSSVGSWSASDSFSGNGTLRLTTCDADGNVTASHDIDLSACASLKDVMDAINATGDLTATIGSDGRLSIASADGSSGVLLSGDGTVAPDGKGFSHAFGFNSLITGDTGNLSVKDIAFPSASISSTTVGEAAFDSGNTDGLQAVWTALQANMSFDSAGELPATEISASGYISAVIDDLADRAQQAGRTADTSAETSKSLASSFINASGVNVDEESALIVTYQQDYQAAAQILTTAQDMWDTLITMMR